MVFLDEITAVVWGLVQGVTEFLPISSSGHLVLLSAFVQELDLFFILVLHLGTLCAVVTYYKEDIAGIISDFFKNPLSSKGRGKWVYAVLIGTVPSVGTAFFLSPLVQKSVQDPKWAGIGFILTGLYLFLSPRGDRGVRKWEGDKHRFILFPFIVGVSQVLAFFPGMSRSGWTIATALFLGFSKREATLFSFLLAIPAITGAMCFELLSASSPSESHSVVALVLAFLSAWFFGYLSLKVLVRSVEKVLFPFFAFYLWPLGLLVLLVFV